MEGVMAIAVTGAMKPLLLKLATLLEKKYKLSKGLKKEIKSLSDELSTMNALLVNLSKMEELNAQQKDWRDKVRELSYDIEDCIETGTFNKLKERYKIAKRVEELKARMVEVSDCHNRYRHDMSIPQPCPVTVAPWIALYADTSSLVGTDRAMDKIIGWLIEGEQQAVKQLGRPCFEPWNFSRFLQEWYYYLHNFFKTPVILVPSKRIKVVSIVGFGGVGKTTLAKQVYTKVKSQFDCTAFVLASRNPNMVKLLSDILSGVGCSEFSSLVDDECKLVSLLSQHLKDKRYLIVIDDVWTLEVWDIIKCLENNLGSKVIITTRIEDVAQAWFPCSDRHVYKIEPLNDFDSRRLFHRSIFGSEDACPEHLKPVSDEIVKICEGFPLAILSVARILASNEKVNSKEIWGNVLLKLERNPDLKGMRRVLSLSYSDLSLDLQPCMLYLGIFPEDSEILKDDLVNRWVAECFITRKPGYGLEEIAESYFNELINRNIIQVADMDDCGHVFSCRVHDVMLEFIILKGTEENFFTIINDLQSTKGSLEVRRLSLQARNSECGNHGLGDMALTQARSLNIWGPGQCMPPLSKFLHLRVLHLDVSDSKGEQCDLSSISKFFLLRYLTIRGVDCKELPRQLRKLQHLTTLEILPRKNTTLEIDVGELPSMLCHLVVPLTVKLIGMMDKMKALRTLGVLDIDPKDVEKYAKGLSELVDLRELKLSLSPDSRQANSVGDLLLPSLCKLGNLQSLIIRGSPVDVDALTLLYSPPCHLHRIHAMVCPLSTVPSDWISRFENLKSMEIRVRTLTRGGVEALAGLNSLVHLRLHVVKHVPEEGVILHRAEFPDLKEFWFANRVPCLVFEPGAMPKLQNLTVQCHAHAEQQQADGGVLDGIEYLESLKTCKVYFVDFSFELQASVENDEYAPTWDRQALEAAIRKSINMHPGSIDISTRTAYSGVYSGRPFFSVRDDFW